MSPGLVMRGPEPTPVDGVYASIWESVRAAYPALPGGPESRDAFLAFVAARVGDTRELARRHVRDLYIAWACDGGDPAALAAFERDVVPALERALSSFADRREVVQVLRERMLVGADGRRGIAAYDGRAPLATWLRVC